MQQPGITVEQSGGEIAVGLGLWYDAERLMLEGVYLDEVTAYRARKGWIEAFETNFLLEERVDFRVRVLRQERAPRFSVVCEFMTACGRYAFWRLTHHQAPEVQFILETAHLPAFQFSDGPSLPEPQVVQPRKEHGTAAAPPGEAEQEVWERIRSLCSSIMETTGSILKWRPRR